MHYRLNVSRNGEHVFCTGETITTFDHAKKVFELLKKSFPKDEGYDIHCVLWEKKGETIHELCN